MPLAYYKKDALDFRTERGGAWSVDTVPSVKWDSGLGKITDGFCLKSAKGLGEKYRPWVGVRFTSAANRAVSENCLKGSVG